jgi:tRNA(Ile)-lysidine synthase
VTIGRADVRGRAAEGKRSIQETAREVRYQFLADVAHRINASWIAVGHTATDQAETLLLRLLRGTGPDGLAGMPVVRDGWIIRPLLGVTREAVLDYARRRGLAWRRDRSNRDPHYTRSRVRMDLLPRLAKDYNPAIVSTLAATARLMAEERQTVDEMLSTMWEQALVAMGPHALSFHRVTIAQQPASVQRWWLRRALRCVQGGPAGTWRRIDEILRRMARVVEGAVALQGGIEVRLTAGRVTVVRRAGPAGDRAARTMRTREREWNSGFSASH